jgi:hypothetical protein
MANLLNSTSIESGMHRYAFYAVNTYSGGGSYLHMETDIAQPSSNVMMMIEAVGYCYSTAKPIRCAWNFYSYAYHIGNSNNTTYDGASADGSYYTSAGYVCIRAYLPGSHYACFILNAYPTAGNGYQQPVSIRRSSQNNTSGAYY